MGRHPQDGLTLSGMSYDNTVGLGASTSAARRVHRKTGQRGRRCRQVLRWLMSSDVRSIAPRRPVRRVPNRWAFGTEFGTVVVQDDVCNGFSHRIPACPFGVIDRREQDGQAHKSTLCYDRLGAGDGARLRQGLPDGFHPVRPLDELRERAQRRVEDLRAAGQDQAQLYLNDPDDGMAAAGVLPAARRARGVRPAAGSGGHHPRPAGDVAACRIAAAGLAATAVALGLGRRR